MREIETGGDKGQAEEKKDDGAEEELLPWREHVDAESNLELVLLECKPLAEGSKDSHYVEFIKPSRIDNVELWYSSS